MFINEIILSITSNIGENFMKKFIAGLMALLMIVSPLGVMTVSVLAESSQTSPFAGGSGTIGDPYIIENVNELQGMFWFPAAHYELGNDIDASETADWNGGLGFEPINTFTGTFNGQNFTISNLFINRPGEDYVGLLGSTNAGFSMDNLGLVDMSITGNDYVGGLVGMNLYGTVSNSYATGTVTGTLQRTGGLVGYNLYGTVSNSHAIVDLNGDSICGGLVGYNQQGAIENSYASVNIYGATALGGLAGYNNAGWINYSYASGTVIGTDFHVGGLVGYNIAGWIDYSYALADAASTLTLAGQFIGGFVGYNDGGGINNSYATGSAIGGANLGGFAGVNTGTIADCFWDITTSGTGTGIGAGTTTGATGLTTAQALTQASYTGWDFGTTWWMVDGNTRPFLRAEASTKLRNSHQLQMMDMDPGTLGADYELMNDIEMDITNPASMWGTSLASGKGFSRVGFDTFPFGGSLSGNGNMIYGLYINRSDNRQGLFGDTTSAIIHDVELIDANITGADYIGGIIGVMTGGSIANCSVTAKNIQGNSNVGGIVGYNLGDIIDTYCRGYVNGTGNLIGGFVGTNAGTIANSYSQGTLIGTAESNGGFAGWNDDTIMNCYSTVDVTGLARKAGFVGENSGTGNITKCYSTGSATSTGAQETGGFGARNDGIISNSYSTGKVIGSGLFDAFFQSYYQE